MRQFKALQVPDLSADVAARLEETLQTLPGVGLFNIQVEAKQLFITFNEQALSMQALAQILAEAGCPLCNMRAFLIQ